MNIPPRTAGRTTSAADISRAGIPKGRGAPRTKAKRAIIAARTPKWNLSTPNLAGHAIPAAPTTADATTMTSAARRSVMVHHLVPAGIFRAVQAPVADLEQLFRIAGVGRKRRDADADGHPKRGRRAALRRALGGLALKRDGLDFAGDILRPSLRLGTRGVRERHQKFLAAPSAGQRPAPVDFADHAADRLQHAIPHRVTIGVVDALE